MQATRVVWHVRGNASQKWRRRGWTLTRLCGSTWSRFLLDAGVELGIVWSFLFFSAFLWTFAAFDLGLVWMGG